MLKKLQSAFITTIVTVCFVGKIKTAPGTFGSFFGLLLHLAVITFLRQSENFYVFISIYLSLLILIGYLSTKSYLRDPNIKNDDPKEVVIDEVIGMSITMTICNFFTSDMFMESLLFGKFVRGCLLIYPEHFEFIVLISHLTLTFILFRFFDILKPWPICWFDKNIKGAFGVILDDIVASLFASVTYYGVILL